MVVPADHEMHSCGPERIPHLPQLPRRVPVWFKLLKSLIIDLNPALKPVGPLGRCRLWTA
jgi:hypothetical protein